METLFLWLIQGPTPLVFIKMCMNCKMCDYVSTTVCYFTASENIIGWHKTIWDHLLSVNQRSANHNFVWPGHRCLIKPTEKCLTMERNKMNNSNPSCGGVSAGQTKVQSGLLSVPEITVWQVQLRAPCQQSDEWLDKTSLQKVEKIWQA